MEKRTIIKYVLIAGALAGASVGGYFMYRYIRRRKTADRVNKLLDLFRKENKLSPSQIERLRFIFEIENYRLPDKIQKDFDKNLPLIKKAAMYMNQKNATAYFQTINTIKSRLPADVLPEFESAVKLVYEVIAKLNEINVDSNTLMARVGRFVKPGVDMVNSFGDYAYAIAIIPALVGSGLSDYVQDSSAVKNNPNFVVMKELYSSSQYSPDVLKLFDELWKVYSGKPFFVTEVKNVKM